MLTDVLPLVPCKYIAINNLLKKGGIASIGLSPLISVSVHLLISPEPKNLDGLPHPSVAPEHSVQISVRCFLLYVLLQ